MPQVAQRVGAKDQRGSAIYKWRVVTLRLYVLVQQNGGVCQSPVRFPFRAEIGAFICDRDCMWHARAYITALQHNSGGRFRQ